jgi:hypothetical protein
MEKAEQQDAQRRIAAAAKQRFPDDAVPEVTVLQYGDDPEVEPGEVVVRIRVPVEPGPDGKPADRDPMHEFHQTYREAIDQFREDIKRELPEARLLEFTADLGSEHMARMKTLLGPLPPDARRGDLTPVMARLGPADLQTLDTLITTGIAANRADAVRWALARIRERPAYEELRQRARQIEELKTQF